MHVYTCMFTLVLELVYCALLLYVLLLVPNAYIHPTTCTNATQVPMELQGVMANIILPCSTQREADALQTHLIEQHRVYIVTGSVPDIVFVRISAQVYLDFTDFEKLARLVKEFFKVL